MLAGKAFLINSYWGDETTVDVSTSINEGNVYQLYQLHLLTFHCGVGNKSKLLISETYLPFDNVFIDVGWDDGDGHGTANTLNDLFDIFFLEHYRNRIISSSLI